jgi:hypothetical protein
MALGGQTLAHRAGTDAARAKSGCARGGRSRGPWPGSRPQTATIASAAPGPAAAALGLGRPLRGRRAGLRSRKESAPGRRGGMHRPQPSARRRPTLPDAGACSRLQTGRQAAVGAPGGGRRRGSARPRRAGSSSRRRGRGSGRRAARATRSKRNAAKDGERAQARASPAPPPAGPSGDDRRAGRNTARPASPRAGRGRARPPRTRNESGGASGGRAAGSRTRQLVRAALETGHHRAERAQPSAEGSGQRATRRTVGIRPT